VPCLAGLHERARAIDFAGFFCVSDKFTSHAVTPLTSKVSEGVRPLKRPSDVYTLATVTNLLRSMTEPHGRRVFQVLLSNLNTRTIDCADAAPMAWSSFGREAVFRPALPDLTRNTA
jgi:hypothetical protein